MGTFWFLTQNDKDVLLFSHQTNSINHDVTETHEHIFEIHNIVLSLQSISLISSKLNLFKSYSVPCKGRIVHMWNKCISTTLKLIFLYAIVKNTHKYKYISICTVEWKVEGGASVVYLPFGQIHNLEEVIIIQF